ncbi:MAG: hypothetical protein ACTSRA_11025 [Promethearchaeota archaeon]
MVNIFGLYLSAMLVSQVYKNFEGVLNDFYEAYLPAAQRFLLDPNTLYINTYCPFKNVPQIIIYFLIFAAVPSSFNLNLVIASYVIIITNFGCLHLLKKILMKEGISKSWIYGLFAFYLITPFQYLEYFHAQLNIFVNFFLLVSIYYFYKEKDHVGYFFLSVASLFKMTVILLIPFILLKDLDLGKLRWSGVLKKLIINLLYLALPYTPSVAIFLLYPRLINTFISVNLYAPVHLNVNWYESSNGSLTKTLTWVFGLDIRLALLISVAIIYPVTLITMLKYKPAIVDRFILGLISAFLIAPDYFPMHNLFLMGIFQIWFSTTRQVRFKMKLLFGLIIYTAVAWLNPLMIFFSFPFYIFLIKELRERVFLSKNEKLVSNEIEE